MKTIYNIQIAARNSEDDFFSSPTKEWKHCVTTIEAAADFARMLLHKSEGFEAWTVKNISFTRYSDSEENGFFGWNGDATVNIDRINNLLKDENNFEILYEVFLNEFENFNFNSNFEFYQQWIDFNN